MQPRGQRIRLNAGLAMERDDPPIREGLVGSEQHELLGDDRNRNRAGFDDDAESRSQCSDHGLEGLSQPLVPVARKRRAPMRRCRERRKLACQRDAEPIQVLGVQYARLGEMCEQRFGTIDGLQNKVIGDLG